MITALVIMVSAYAVLYEIAGCIVFKKLHRKLRAEAEAKYGFEKLKGEYFATWPEKLNPIVKKAILGILVVFPVVGLSFAMPYLASVIHSRGNETVYVRGLSPEFWIYPSVAIMVPVFFGVYYAAMRVTYREKFGKWRAYKILDNEHDIIRKNLYTAVILLLIAAVLAVGGFNSYVLIGRDKITVNRFHDLKGKDFEYSSIGSITRHSYEFKPTDSNVRNVKYFVISFKSGESWSTGEVFFNWWEAKDKEMIGYVSERSGVPIKDEEGK
ncbi:MAG: hypothetical protein ACYS8W_11885 [Planctomycetota bacterium]|jgi:hypothetical protein